jgi:uncharacterized membrane-anchored protein YitT (DUF2179 family)
MGKVIDTVLEGVSYEKSVSIISEKNEEIARLITATIQRGGTLMQGKGIYNGEERTMLMTVLNRRELTILLQHIKSIDPEAFVTVVGASKILGKGFKSLEDFDTD